MPRAYFDDFEPGQDWGTTQWVASEDICDTWTNLGLGRAPDNTAPDVRRVPAALVQVALAKCIQDKLREKPPGGIHAKQKFMFALPAYVNDTLTTQLIVKDKYLKRERKYVEFESITRNQSGQVIATGLRTTIWAA